MSRKPGRPVGTHAPPVFTRKLNGIPITEEMDDALKTESLDRVCSVSSIVRDAVNRELKRHR